MQHVREWGSSYAANLRKIFSGFAAPENVNDNPATGGTITYARMLELAKDMKNFDSPLLKNTGISGEIVKAVKLAATYSYDNINDNPNTGGSTYSFLSTRAQDGLPSFGFSEECKDELKDATLDQLIKNAGLPYSNMVLTEEQREYLKQFIFWDDAGFTYTNADGLCFIYLLDKKFGTEYNFSHFPDDYATEEFLKAPNPSGMVGIFYLEDGKWYNCPISQADFPKYQESIALMNISKLPASEYEKFPNTFRLYGLEWFNHKKHQTIMGKQISQLTQHDINAVSEMSVFAYDLLLTQNRPYLIEQLIASSTLISTEGVVGALNNSNGAAKGWPPYMISPVFTFINQRQVQYTSLLLRDLGISDFADTRYQNSQELNYLVDYVGFMSAISGNAYSNNLVLAKDGFDRDVNTAHSINHFLKKRPLYSVEPFMALNNWDQGKHVGWKFVHNKDKNRTFYSFFSDTNATDLIFSAIKDIAGEESSVFFSALSVLGVEGGKELIEGYSGLDVTGFGLVAALEGIFGKGAGIIYEIPKAVAEKIVETKKDNRRISVTANLADFGIILNILGFSGQLNVNSDGTVTTTIAMKDREKMNYFLYKTFPNDHVTIDTLWGEIDEIYRGKGSGGSIFDFVFSGSQSTKEYWFSKFYQEGPSREVRNNEWSKIEDHITSYNEKIGGYNSDNPQDKLPIYDLKELTPSQIDTFEDAYPIFVRANDDGFEKGEEISLEGK